MNDYTPITSDIRVAWMCHHMDNEDASPMPMNRIGGEFDRWLDEVERAAAEKAWDELAQKLAHDWYWHDGGKNENPYRKEAS